MKKSKKKILIAIIVLVIIIVILGLVLFNITKKEKKEEVKKEIQTGIAKNIRFEGYEYLDSVNDCLILKKDKKIILKNVNTLEEIETNYDTFVDVRDGLILFEREKKYVLANTNGEDVATSNKAEITTYQDSYTKKVYYLINDTLYDLDNNKIFQNKLLKSNYFYISGNILVQNDPDGNNIIYNLGTKKIIKYKTYNRFGDYLVARVNNKKYILYDLKNNAEKEYQIFKEQNNGYILSNGSENIYFDKLNLIKTDKLENKIVLSDKYYIDYETACGKLVNSDTNKLVVNGCVRDLYKPEQNKLITIINIDTKDDFKSYALLPNGDLKEKSYEDSVSEDYLSFYNYDENEENVIVYDMNGKEVNQECFDTINLAGKNNYYCYNGVYENLLDKKLNIKEKYDIIECQEEYCIVKKNSRYGLLYNGKEILKTNNISVKINGKCIIVENVFGINVLFIDSSNDLPIEDLSIEDNVNTNIDIEKLIEDFKLESIKDIIYDNEELFKKYAYIVMHNNNLNSYKKQVFDIFKVVVDNKEYLDEEYFLYSLSKLKINVKNKLSSNNISGEYYDDEIKIDLLKEYKNDPLVYYHELMHFLDHKFNEEKETYYFKEENKYLLNEDIDKYDKNKKRKITEYGFDTQNKLITESGAEYYMAKYFNNGKLSTYYFPCQIFISLNYLFGNDKAQEIFFSDRGVYYLKNLLLEYSLTNKEIDTLLTLWSEVTYDENYDYKNIIKIVDLLVKMYNSKNENSWTSDKEFSFIISNILTFTDLYSTKSQNKKDYIKISSMYDDDFSLKALKSLGINDNLENQSYLIPYCFRENNKTYIMIASYKVEYDFKKNKAISYEKV